jgi:hypothetical protein
MNNSYQEHAPSRAPINPDIPDIPSFEELAADPEIAALLDFDPVPRKVKRPDGWTPELQRELIARMAAAGTLQEAVWQMGKHATGAEGLYKTPAADSFRAAWDAALAIGRRRNGLDPQPPYAGEVPGITRRVRRSAAPGGPAPGEVRNEDGEWEDEGAFMGRVDEAMERMRKRMLAARRLYLQEISDSPGKRAAFEILTQLPIDWDKAERLEPQEDEPWQKPNMRRPEMLLTAENGWLGDMLPGPHKMAELRRALDEERVKRGLEPIRWEDEESE